MKHEYTRIFIIIIIVVDITTDKYVHITSLGSLNNNARLPPFPHPTNISVSISTIIAASIISYINMFK